MATNIIVLTSKTSNKKTGKKISLITRKKRTYKYLINIILLLIAVCFLFPLMWLVLASFDKNAGLNASLPASFTLENYASILTPEQTIIPIVNSLLISSSVALLTIVIAVLAAYPLSRYRSSFNSGYLYSILFMSGLPITAMMIPVYSLFVTLNLLDSTGAVIIFLTASSLPMAIFMTKNFMDGIPISLEEAAWIDGASRMKGLFKITVPLMKAGLSAVGIFVFVSVWGNFFVPYILFVDPNKMPASVSIYSFFGQHGIIAYGQLAAFSIIYTIPAVLLYLILTRVFGMNALAGGVKG